MATILEKSRSGLATLLGQILQGKISSDEAVKVLLCYLIREGTVTEISLPTPTE